MTVRSIPSPTLEIVIEHLLVFWLGVGKSFEPCVGCERRRMGNHVSSHDDRSLGGGWSARHVDKLHSCQIVSQLVKARTSQQDDVEPRFHLQFAK